MSEIPLVDGKQLYETFVTILFNEWRDDLPKTKEEVKKMLYEGCMNMEKISKELRDKKW